MSRLLDPAFKWIPSTSTSVSATWKRFGFKPTTPSERAARQKREPATPSNVTPITKRKDNV